MSGSALRPAIHAWITPDAKSGYVATCEEIAVVTQGETLDEVTAHLREAVALHLEGEDLAALGFAAQSTIFVTLKLAPTYASWGVDLRRASQPPGPQPRRDPGHC